MCHVTAAPDVPHKYRRTAVGECGAEPTCGAPLNRPLSTFPSISPVTLNSLIAYQPNSSVSHRARMLGNKSPQGSWAVVSTAERRRAPERRDGRASCVRSHKQPRSGYWQAPGSVRAFEMPRTEAPNSSISLFICHPRIFTLFPPCFPASLLACVWDEVFRLATPRCRGFRALPQCSNFDDSHS